MARLNSYLDDLLGLFVIPCLQEGEEEVVQHRHLTLLLAHKVHR